MSKRALAISLSGVIILVALAAFALRPRWVYGYVTDAETGQPLAGVHITIDGQRTITDETGYFQLGDVRGLAVLQVAADGYNATNIPLAFAGIIGLRPEMIFALEPVELQGTVTDITTGAPLAGVTVRAGELEARTDDKGRYSLKRLLQDQEIRVQAKYYQVNEPAAYSGQAVQDVALTLLPVTVTVRDEFGGEALAGATVQAGDQALESDAEGKVVFARLAPASEITGSKDGYKDGKATASPGDTVVLNLRPPIIGGKVTDQNGQPLAKALVLLRTPDREPQTAYTNEQGAYTLRSSQTGGTLIVRLAGYKRAERQLSADASTDFQLEPFIVKGIYLHLGMLLPVGAEQLQENIAMVERTELNAVIIDIKSDKGFLAFKPKYPVAQEIDASYDGVLDLRELVQDLQSRNIYTIARMVIFKDDVLAEGKPEWAVHNGSGGLWRDDIGSAYADPFRKEVWEYNVALAKEVAEMGFDEIQFDYLRFPSDGNIFDTHYIQEENRAARTKAIQSFVAYARQELDKTGAFFSLDLFGMTTSIDTEMKYGDLGIGQQLADLAPYADYISPMIYPSTYGPGNLGLANPKNDPYNVVKISVADGRERANGTLVRPWLQHYSLFGIGFGVNEFRLEKQAAEEAGAYGWMFWNSPGVYMEATFDPE